MKRLLQGITRMQLRFCAPSETTIHTEVMKQIIVEGYTRSNVLAAIDLLHNPFLSNG
jgi:hypothetical protein